MSMQEEDPHIDVLADVLLPKTQEDLLPYIVYLAKKNSGYPDTLTIDGDMYEVVCKPTTYDHTITLRCQERGICITFYGGVEYTSSGSQLLIFSSDETWETYQGEFFFQQGDLMVDQHESYNDATPKTIAYVVHVLDKLQQAS